RPDRPGHAPDVAAGVKVASAGREIAAFDAPDDCLSDAGPLTNLRNGETRLAARVCQGVTNAHATPPLPYRTACRPGCGSSSRMGATLQCRIANKCRHSPERTAGRRRSRSVLPAPERINHTIGVLGPDQDVPGLGTFARPDDAPALQQVHEPACFRETHPQFALQHR